MINLDIPEVADVSVNNPGEVTGIAASEHGIVWDLDLVCFPDLSGYSSVF